MKTKPSAIKSLLAAALAASCLASYAAAPQKREMKFEKLRKEFADPPRAFRPAPLWVWNTRVTRADIDRMLGDFKAQGFGGAFVHPRPGLVTEYLSDEWFDLYKYSVEKGKELGLDIWIYDENSYPSGFAGGHVPAQMPESYDQGQGLALTKTALPPADAGKYFLCLKKEGGTFRDITADTGRYKDVPGEYYLYEKTYYGRSGWHGGYSYVDLLVEGVTEKFLDITMSGYEKTFGNELGPVIRGLFSDEPCIPSSGGVRWTPDLFEVFRKQWGYDLATSLPLLSEQTGDWKQVRHNYLETLTQMFVDRWAKPMSAYCDRKGMLWTGHYWEHDWPSMYQGGDNMAMYAWHQMPAIDMLFNQYNDQSPQAQFGNVRAVKELRSAANQTGCVRTLSETYGGGGWDETFRDFKRLGDWEYALGVNFMNQHLSHMTIAGARKYDYPPVFTRLSPWWEDYKVLNDYFARLSLVLSQGEQMNDILVLEPTTT
ncbi:MAG: glycosyl hydrolase, partial [Alistipes onderdonkii]